MIRIISIKTNFTAFKEVLSIFTKHRSLTVEMAKREITERYTGQILGAAWAIGHPLILMGIYVFIFGFVFKVGIGGTRELPLDYTTYLLSGLIPWMAFQESMSKGTTVIVNNSNLVKQVVFPIEILPVKGVIASFITQIISTTILVVYVFVKNGFLPWTYLLIPIICFFQILAMIGVSYILSAIGVYFRDIKDFVQVFCVAGMYTMPIFYLPEMVPKLFKPILYLNPFSYMIWCFQDTLYFGAFKHPLAWIIFILISVFLFCTGYRTFKKLKVYFGNVL